MFFGLVYSCWLKKRKRCNIVRPKYRLQDSLTLYASQEARTRLEAGYDSHSRLRNAIDNFTTNLRSRNTKVELIPEGCISRLRRKGCASPLHAPSGAPAAMANASKLLRIPYLRNHCMRSIPRQYLNVPKALRDRMKTCRSWCFHSR